MKIDVNPKESAALTLEDVNIGQGFEYKGELYLVLAKETDGFATVVNLTSVMNGDPEPVNNDMYHDNHVDKIYNISVTLDEI